MKSLSKIRFQSAVNFNNQLQGQVSHSSIAKGMNARPDPSDDSFHLDQALNNALDLNQVYCPANCSSTQSIS